MNIRICISEKDRASLIFDRYRFLLDVSLTFKGSDFWQFSMFPIPLPLIFLENT